MVAFPQIRLKTEQNFPKSDESLIPKLDENHKIDENKMKFGEGKLDLTFPGSGLLSHFTNSRLTLPF
jgi:hypothetical protein